MHIVNFNILPQQFCYKRLFPTNLFEDSNFYFSSSDTWHADRSQYSAETKTYKIQNVSYKTFHSYQSFITSSKLLSQILYKMHEANYQIVIFFQITKAAHQNQKKATPDILEMAMMSTVKVKVCVLGRVGWVIWFEQGFNLRLLLNILRSFLCLTHQLCVQLHKSSTVPVTITA